MAVFIVFIVLVFAIFYAFKSDYSSFGNMVIPLTIKNNYFKVEIVSNEQKMQLGLGKRSDICNNCGMLFKFKEAGKHSFWMKDMLFPIDIIWIFNNKIVYIEKNVQPDFPGTLNPDEISDAVLELKAGNVDNFGILIRDTIIF